MRSIVKRLRRWPTGQYVSLDTAVAVAAHLSPRIHWGKALVAAATLSAMARRAGLSGSFSRSPASTGGR